MAVIGSATLNVVPKIQGGLANAINGELKSANLAGMGKAAGGSLMDGFASGASIGIWSSVASKAIGAVTDSLGSAASRVDTLRNYPKIMESLGVAGDVAQASMDKMSTSLDNVPTRLDDMASTVQGIYAATMKYGTGLDTVTDAGLALNSMLLAGGQSTSVVNSAMEQFRQMVAKGKPDLQDWRALISAAPGQMDQLSKAMLGAEATADDLYAALGGGKEGDYEGPFEWGSISMGEFIERFAGLRDQFEGAAEDAQGGIQTSFANMRNAVTKGVANVLDAFGQDRIASAMGDVKSMINDVFGRDDTQGLRAFATEVAPMVSEAWDSMVEGVGDFAERVAPSFDSVGDALVRFAQDVGPSVGDAMSTVGDVIADLAPTFADTFAGTMDSAADVVKGVADLVSDVAPTVGSIAQDVLPMVADVAGAVAPALPVILTAKTAFGGLSTVLGGMSAAGTAISGVASSLGAIGSVLPMIGSLSDVPAALGLLAESGVGVAGALNPVPALIGAAAIGVGAYAVKTYTAWKREQDFQGAIAGVGDAVTGMTQGLSNGARDVSDYGEANQRAKADIDGLVRAMEDYATRTGRIHDSAAEDIGMLGQYKTVIDEAAKATLDGGELSADGMARLEWALKGLNELTGSDYQVSDIVNPDEPDKIRDTIDAIDELIAKRQEQARTEALQDTLTESYKLQQKAATELSRAQNDAAKAQQDWNDKYDYYVSQGYDEKMAAAYANQAVNLSDYQDALGKTTGAYKEATAAVEANERALGNAATATSNADDAMTSWYNGSQLVQTTLAENNVSLDELARAMGDSGVATEKLSEMGDIAFSQLANSCAGNVDQMVAALALYDATPIEEKNGEVVVDDAMLVDAQGTVYTWNGTALMDKDGNVAVDGSQLMDAYGNMVIWNAATLTDKSGAAYVADGELTDAQGNVYTWNGTALVDKNGKVVTEDTQLRDTHQRVVNYNAMSISPKSAVVTTSDDGLSGLIQRVRDFMSLPSNVSRTATYTTRNVTINETRSETSGTTYTGGGGHYSTATGGHVEPRHAAGYIAAGPTRTNWGLVGENGVEAVYNNADGSSDVYPLNNPRYLSYADPLADRIADAMAQRGGLGAPVQVVLDYKAGKDPNQMVRDLSRALQRVQRTRR